MKKRCTASACRRWFNSRRGTCPYCGREYPQLNGTRLVWLCGYSDPKHNKIPLIRLYRALHHTELRESKDMVEQTLCGKPLLYGTFNGSRVEAEKLANELRELGGSVKVTCR